jgi:hypothetical protein
MSWKPTMNWKQILAIGAVCLGLLFLWMHRHRYESYGGSVVRTHRITGETELYTPPRGWTNYDESSSNASE